LQRSGQRIASQKSGPPAEARPLGARDDNAIANLAEAVGYAGAGRDWFDPKRPPDNEKRTWRSTAVAFDDTGVVSEVDVCHERRDFHRFRRRRGNC